MSAIQPTDSKGPAVKTANGNGVVKKAGDKVLKTVEDKDGNYTAESEGYFTYEYPEVASLDEIIAFFEEVDAKGVKVNALTTGTGDEKVVLSAEQSMVQLVNNELKRMAKANAYQKTVAKFKPAEDPKAAFEKIVRTFISLGLPEDMAIQHAKAAIAENEARVSAATAETTA